MEKVTQLQVEVKARNEAAHKTHHNRADIHERVRSQIHGNLGQTAEDMRIRDEKLQAELTRT